MFVILKNESGGFSVRPAYIGFIENNLLRRSLCCLFYPLTILVTLALNLIQATLVMTIILIKAIYYPFINLKTPIWKTEIWKRPRTKADKHSRMN